MKKPAWQRVGVRAGRLLLSIVVGPGGEGKRESSLVLSGKLQGLFYGLGCAFFARFRALVVEDAEQMASPLHWSHRIPGGLCLWDASEGELQDWRHFAFALHGKHHSLGQLLGAMRSRLVALGSGDPFSNIASC